MMKFAIPKIKKAIDLKLYAEEFGEARVTAWVNPPVALLEKFAQFTKGVTAETVDEALEVIGQLWGWDEEEVKELFEHSQETDPKLFEWLVLRTFTAIHEHRTGVKKNWIRQ